MSEPEATTESNEGFDTHALALAIVEAAWERKARSARILDVRGIVSYTDYLVLCHGTSEPHARAIANAVIDDLRPVKVRPIGVEGKRGGDWLLIDFADAVLHFFTSREARDDYNFESMYSDAPRVELEDAPDDLEDGPGGVSYHDPS